MHLQSTCGFVGFSEVGDSRSMAKRDVGLHCTEKRPEHRADGTRFCRTAIRSEKRQQLHVDGNDTSRRKLAFQRYHTLWRHHQRWTLRPSVDIQRLGDGCLEHGGRFERGKNYTEQYNIMSKNVSRELRVVCTTVISIGVRHFDSFLKQKSFSAHSFPCALVWCSCHYSQFFWD